MRPGGGSQKGSEFERTVCRTLSLWVSHGERIDLFWRASMSGGRATVSRGKVDQGGDITAVDPLGHVLTNRFLIECKHCASLDLDGLLFGRGKLVKFWAKACAQAAALHRHPLLIAKQNRRPAIVVCRFAYPHWCAYYDFGAMGKAFIYPFATILHHKFEDVMDMGGLSHE